MISDNSALACDHLIGVIDLRHGVPVHAVAGERHAYRPLHERGRSLNAMAMIERYRRSGVRRFYVADLDGIVDRRPGWKLLTELADRLPREEELLIDAGWRGSESGPEIGSIRRLLAERAGRISLIAAAESAKTPDAPARLAELAGEQAVWLGFDYRDGRWIGRSGDEQTWLRSGERGEFAGIVVLDLTSVGTGAGPKTGPIVRRIKTALPETRIISGGGIRDNADVAEMIAAGVDRCLVATALLR